MQSLNLQGDQPAGERPRPWWMSGKSIFWLVVVAAGVVLLFALR